MLNYGTSPHFHFFHYYVTNTVIGLTCFWVFLEGIRYLHNTFFPIFYFYYIIKLHNFSPPKLLLKFSYFINPLLRSFTISKAAIRGMLPDHLCHVPVCAHHPASLRQDLARGRAHLMNC